MITLRVTKDSISPDLRRLLGQCRADGALGKVLGRAAANELRRHFRARNSQGNALGGKRTHFWPRVAESVHSPLTKGSSIVVPINHPAIGLKVHGGTITARKAKNLAIPVDPRAHGKSPRVLSGLHFAMTGTGVKLLGLTENGKFTALYVLKKSVSQRPDPRALPPDAAVATAMEKAGRILTGRR